VSKLSQRSWRSGFVAIALSLMAHVLGARLLSAPTSASHAPQLAVIELVSTAPVQVTPREEPPPPPRARVVTVARANHQKPVETKDVAEHDNRAQPASNASETPAEKADEEVDEQAEEQAGATDAPEPNGSAGTQAEATGAGGPARSAMAISASLDTNASEYAAFFNRLKKSVADEWKPGEVIKRYAAGPSLASRDSSHATVLAIVLDEQGRVSQAEVEQSCGYGFLDMESIAALKRAAPFSRPPAGLLDQDRHIRFRYRFDIVGRQLGMR
jgi:periplasmic protein TonB